MTANILQLIEQTKTVSPDNVPNLLSSISDYICKNKITDDETDKLIELILNSISNKPPSIQRSTFSLCNNVLDIVDFPPQKLSEFSTNLLNHLKTILSLSPEKAKTLYDEAITLTRHVLKVVGADSFWKIFSSCFMEKSPYLNIVSLDLLYETLNIEENFKTASFIQTVFRHLREKSNSEVKKRAYNIAELLYNRRPETVIKLLNKIFLTDAEPIIEQIKKDVESSTNEEAPKETTNDESMSQCDGSSQCGDFDKMSTSSFMSKASRASSRLSVCSTKKDTTSVKNDKNSIQNNRPVNGRPSLGGKKRSHIPVNRIVKGSYIAGASEGENKKTPEEIEKDIIAEFESPLKDQTPKSGNCPFNEISQKVTRDANNDWEIRAAQLESIVGYARGSQNKAQFARNLNILKDGFESCVNDFRSALSKRACICISAIAEALENKIDLCCDWLLPLVVNRVGKDTFTIPAELAAISIIKNVSKGTNSTSFKSTRRQLEELVKHKNEKVRVVAVKCITVAIEYWNKEASKGLEKILEEKSRDQSEKVRSIASSFTASLVATKAASAQIRTEDIILDNDDEDEEMKSNFDSEISKNAFDETIFEVESLHGESLKGLVDQKNMELISAFIQQTNCNLLGFIQPIIEMICEGFQSDSIENIRDSTQLLSLLCANYSNSLYPFLFTISQSLPNDSTYSKIAISKLSSAFGSNAIARLFANSTNSSACEFVLKFAEKQDNNISFAVKSVYLAVSNHHYESHRDLIIKLLKKIHSYDSLKCEALISSINQDDRKIILADVKESISPLYHAFIKDDSDYLSDKLYSHLNSIKSKKNQNQENSENDSNSCNIDISLIQKAFESNSTECLLLAITIIRESKTFLSKELVSFLLKCSASNNKEVSIASSLAMMKCAQDKSISIDDFLDQFMLSDGAFKTLTELMKNQEINDSRLDEINKKIRDGVCSLSVKYSALAVIAYICKNICSSYLSIYGDLSFVNQKLLQSFM